MLSNRFRPFRPLGFTPLLSSRFEYLICRLAFTFCLFLKAGGFQLQPAGNKRCSRSQMVQFVSGCRSWEIVMWCGCHGQVRRGGLGMGHGGSGWPRDLWEFGRCWNGGCGVREGAFDYGPHKHVLSQLVTEMCALTLKIIVRVWYTGLVTVKQNIDFLMIKISVLLVAVVQEFFFFLSLLEASALTGNVATEPVRVGGVFAFFFLFFLHGT